MRLDLKALPLWMDKGKRHSCSKYSRNFISMELTGKKYRAKAWFKDQFAYYVIEFLANEQVLINHRSEDDTNITDRSLVDCQVHSENNLIVMIDNKAYEGTIQDELLTFVGLPRNYYLY